MFLRPSEGTSTIQFSSVTQSCPTLCDPMNCSTPGLPVHHQLPELTQTHVHCVGDAIQPSHPLLSPSPPAFNLSQTWVSPSHQVAKYWSFSFHLSPEHWLISFRMDSLDLLAVQGTLRSLLQHHSSLYSVQFSHSVVSDSLRPHESQHARRPCPSPAPGFTQTHVHWVSDAIQPSHPQSSPSPPAPNPSQHQGLF